MSVGVVVIVIGGTRGRKTSRTPASSQTSLRLHRVHSRHSILRKCDKMRSEQIYLSAMPREGNKLLVYIAMQENGV